MVRMTKLKRMTRNMYTTREPGTGTCFVLTDNKCILSCAVIWSKQPFERKQRSAENETVRGIYISQFLFRFFPQDYAIKAKIDLELLPFIRGGPK